MTYAMLGGGENHPDEGLTRVNQAPEARAAGGASEVDVLIVGAGPVGAVLGCLLGRYGVTTLLVDQAPAIPEVPRAIALDNEALRVLQLAGLAPGAFETLAIAKVRMRSPHVGDFARINTAGALDGHPKLSTFHQPDLERALARELASHPSVTLQRGVTLESFVDRGAHVTATLRRAHGPPDAVRARYLVGADGAASAVREAIGQRFAGQTYSEDWLIVDARGVPGGFDHVEFLCDPERPTAHMVAPGGRTRWEFMLRPGETRDAMERDETLERLLAPWARLEAITLERRAVYRFHARSCARYSQGRVFLVGDAAHITPPFAGQGLVSGLRDAANLGWKLAWTLRGHAAEASLASYDRERRPHATRMITLAKVMGRLVMPRSLVAAILLHGTMRLVRLIPGARALFDEMKVKPKNAFREGLFVAGRGRLSRGGSLPQTRVHRASGEEILSDEALGPHLALVGFGVDPAAYLDASTREAFRAHGGRAVSFFARGQRPTGGSDAFEDRTTTLVPRTAPVGWCAVVRPDRQILHDGPAKEAARVVRESLALLDGR